MKNVVLFFILSLFFYKANSQQITYSQPETDDVRYMDFNIIGKINGNFLVYKHIRNNYGIGVYDNDMNLNKNVNLDFIPDRTINVDFIAYPDFAYIIYQYQKRNILYCKAAAVDGTGKIIKQPFDLDTTDLRFLADNKIYSTIHSEDKSRIMIFKIQKKNDKYNFTTILFDDSLRMLHKSKIEANYNEHNDVFSDFFVDNAGNFVFTKGYKLTFRDYLQNLTLYTKAPYQDGFSTFDLNLSGKYLDELKLKIDNINKQYLLNSLFYSKKNGNIEGLYTAVWDKKNDSLVSQNFQEFSDSLRYQAKSEGSVKTAFNDFFINNVILKNDGGFILTAEDHSTQSRGIPWNRYDYLYGYPSFSPFNYYNLYSPSSYLFYNQYQNFYNGMNQVRYYYQNLIIMNLDKQGNLQWSKVMNKSQYDDNNDNFLSYGIMLTGGKIYFLFNQLERRNQLLNEQSITADGTITRNPPLKSLDRGYDFMPRYAKQVSSYQVIVPCMYRNYICFAKIEY